MQHSNYHRATARSARTATIPLKLCVNKTITMLVGICLVLAFLFLLFPAKALAYSPTQQRYVGSATTYPLNPTANGPTLQVSAGFDTHYRAGNWVPVQVTLHNPGPEFN